MKKPGKKTEPTEFPRHWRRGKEMKPSWRLGKRCERRLQEGNSSSQSVLSCLRGSNSGSYIHLLKTKNLHQKILLNAELTMFPCRCKYLLLLPLPGRPQAKDLLQQARNPTQECGLVPYFCVISELEPTTKCWLLPEKLLWNESWPGETSSWSTAVVVYLLLFSWVGRISQRSLLLYTPNAGVTAPTRLLICSQERIRLSKFSQITLAAYCARALQLQGLFNSLIRYQRDVMGYKKMWSFHFTDS